MAQKGHDVHVLTMRESAIPSVQVHTIRPIPYIGKVNYFFKLRNFLNFINNIKPDIIDIQFLTSSGFIGNQIEGFPIVATAWGSDVLISPQKSKFLFKTVRDICFKAEKVISVSDHITEKLIQMGVNREKIETFPIGVDLSLFSKQITKSKPEELIILSTRWHEPIYNLELLIEAIPIILKNIPNARFIVAGDGSRKQNLEKRVKELGASKRVEFIGKVEHTKLVSLYCLADIYISTSLSDGSSESLFEAFAGQAFPIVTDIQANRSWINNGVNGFLVPTDKPEFLAQRIIEISQSLRLMNHAAEFNLSLVKDRADLKKNMDRLEDIYLKSIENWRSSNESAIS